MNFFIADDEITQIAEWEAFIKKEGYKVIGHGRNETDVFRELRLLTERKKLPEFIILDMKFGGSFRQGFEILEKIKQDSKYNEIKVIVSSRYDDKAVIKEIITRDWASAYISKKNRHQLGKALDKINTDGYYFDQISRPILRDIPRYIDREAIKFFNKIILQLLPQEEKDRIKKRPQYKEIGEEHIEFLKIHYKKHKKLDCPIHLNLENFKTEVLQILNYDFTATQWIIFKEIAKGRSSTKVVANCNTTANNVNASVPEILSKLGYPTGHGNWSVFLIEALKMHLIDIIDFIENESSLNIQAK